jgi:ribonuclease HI
MDEEKLRAGLEEAICGATSLTAEDGLDEAVSSVMGFLSSNYSMKEVGPETNVEQTLGEVVAYFDGNGNATNGKPGLAQWQLHWANGTMTPGLEEYPAGHPGMTNNFLEYKALTGCINALLLHLGHGSTPSSIKIKGDSRLVIEQVNRVWRTKEASLVPLKDKAQELLSQLRLRCPSVTLEWCPSGKNLVDSHG